MRFVIYKVVLVEEVVVIHTVHAKVAIATSAGIAAPGKIFGVTNHTQETEHV